MFQEQLIIHNKFFVFFNTMEELITTMETDNSYNPLHMLQVILPLSWFFKKKATVSSCLSFKATSKA